jgi:hypothetical protein
MPRHPEFRILFQSSIFLDIAAMMNVMVKYQWFYHRYRVLTHHNPEMVADAFWR